MGYEDSLEKGTSGAPSPRPAKMTLAKAVEFGEYNPGYLSSFPEWHTLSRFIQFQYIRSAVENRRKQLLMQYAEINNMLDFRLKPQLSDALKSIEKQLKMVEIDREKLFIEYSK